MFYLYKNTFVLWVVEIILVCMVFSYYTDKKMCKKDLHVSNTSAVSNDWQSVACSSLPLSRLPPNDCYLDPYRRFYHPLPPTLIDFYRPHIADSVAIRRLHRFLTPILKPLPPPVAVYRP